jgi:DNA-binding GntR family transcriptional regulator
METGLRFKSIGETLTDHLRHLILSGELAEGECLRQERIARQHRVSAVIVREAFRRLEAEGLLEAEPRRGVRVSRLSVEEIADIYDLRIILEELIARQAAKNCTEETFLEANAILKRMDREDDPVQWLTLNRDFHLCLSSPSNRKHLLKYMDHFRAIVDRYLRISLGVLKGFDIAQREHRSILTAFRARDPSLAARRVGTHLRRTADFVASFLKIQNLQGVGGRERQTEREVTESLGRGRDKENRPRGK